MSHYNCETISNITLLGSGEKIQWSQAADALTIKLPEKMPNDIAIVFKLALRQR